jgi:peptidoglycan/LPS O-acetylase OafA/YrhL
VGRCSANGWANLFYLNNLLHQHESHELKPCLGHTWYLAADMQLFAFSPAVFLPLYHWQRCNVGLKLWLAWFCAATAIPFGLTLQKDLPPIPIE